jgi:hypothetical protein
MLTLVLSIVFFALAIMGGLWGYNKFLGKAPCGCKD